MNAPSGHTINPSDTTNHRVIRPLRVLNFFMADLQAGIGPFLGIFLLAHGWKSGPIGSVMTIGGVAGMLMTAPAGALIDVTSRKRMHVVISAIFTAIAGAIIGAAVIGMTLGIVRQAGFNRQNGYNQAYNHAGNVAGAALSGWPGFRFGMPAIFILAAALACFHLGNGAMLPLYGLAAAAKNQGDPSVFVAMTIVIAQLVMVVASLVAMRMADKRGYWLVLLISFMALPLRGFIAAHWIDHKGVCPVQILDGIGAGLQSVAVPGLVASLSPGIGGWLAQGMGYPSTFLLLGRLALISILLWLIFAPMLRAACDS